jgi:uncharacterized protein YerC
MASFPVTLIDQPRQQFRLFYRAAVAAYGAACTTVYQHGLLGFIVSDTQWEQLPGNVVPNADPAQPNDISPRPTITIPATPPTNATALTIKIWERRLADNVLVTDNLRSLKAQLIASVQPADIIILHDPFFGLLNVPALTIMNHLTELHGTLNRSDFAHLRLQLSLPMTANESLQDFIGTHQLLHDQFAEAHQPLSELDKCHHFREAIKTLPHINHAIDSYLVAHPLVEAQNYRDLTAHTVNQAPNFTPTAVAMGYAALTTNTNTSLNAEDVPALLRSPAFAALITAAVKAATPSNPRPSRARNPAAKHGPPAIPNTNRLYCFHHGYDGHHSADCRYMSTNDFSAAKRTATDHTALTGASTTRL